MHVDASSSRHWSANLFAFALAASGLLAACEGDDRKACRAPQPLEDASTDGGSCALPSPDDACRQPSCRQTVVTGCPGRTHQLDAIVPPRCEGDADCCAGSTCVELNVGTCCPDAVELPKIRVCWPR